MRQGGLGRRCWSLEESSGTVILCHNTCSAAEACCAGARSDRLRVANREQGLRCEGRGKSARWTGSSGLPVVCVMASKRAVTWNLLLFHFNEAAPRRWPGPPLSEASSDNGPAAQIQIR